MRVTIELEQSSPAEIVERHGWEVPVVVRYGGSGRDAAEITIRRSGPGQGYSVTMRGLDGFTLAPRGTIWGPVGSGMERIADARTPLLPLPRFAYPRGHETDAVSSGRDFGRGVPPGPGGCADGGLAPTSARVAEEMARRENEEG